MRHDAERDRFLCDVRLVRGGPFPYGAAPTVKTLLACSAVDLLALNGCAASSEADDEGTDAAVVPDVGVKDTATKKDSEPECVQNCTMDTDCQNSCPVVPNGENCCDTSTGVCYAYSQTTCPTPVMDAGFD
jgi:hypothetical protein